MYKSALISELIQEYCLRISSDFDSQVVDNHNALLQNLVQETIKTMPRSEMLSDPLLVKLLRFLIKIKNATNILEIGTYTGYASLAMAEALGPDGNLITCEIDPTCLQFARKYFEQSPYSKKIKSYLGPALETIQGLDQKFDLVYIDANKSEYPDYYHTMLPRLNPSGIIIIDNTLQRGGVVEPKPNRIAAKIANFNEMLRKDPRVEVLLLPFGDGVSLVILK